MRDSCVSRSTSRCARAVLPACGASAARLVVSDTANVIELKLATVEKLLFDLYTRALHARLRARERDSQLLAQCLLRQTLILGQAQRLSVRLGQRSDHCCDTRTQLAQHIVVAYLLRLRYRLNKLGGRSPRSIVVGNRVAGDLVDPAGQPVGCAQCVDMGMNLEEDILQDIFGAVRIWH